MIKAQALDFLRAAGNVALFAGTDKTLPAIAVVHFRLDVRYTLIAEATDRATFAREEIRSAQGDLYGLDVSVKAPELAAAVKALRAVLKRQDRPAAAEIQIELDPSGTFDVTLTGLDGGDHGVYLPTLAPDEYLPFPAAVFDAAMAGHQAALSDLGTNPWERRHVFAGPMLARLAKVETDTGAKLWNVELQFTKQGAPACAVIGTAFTALVMPIIGG